MNKFKDYLDNKLNEDYAQDKFNLALQKGVSAFWQAMWEVFGKEVSTDPVTEKELRDAMARTIARIQNPLDDDPEKDDEDDTNKIINTIYKSDDDDDDEVIRIVPDK